MKFFYNCTGTGQWEKIGIIFFSFSFYFVFSDTFETNLMFKNIFIVSTMRIPTFSYIWKPL